MTDKGSTNAVVQIELPEVIDERVDLTIVLGKTHPQMRIDCSKLKRINSVGIRALKTTLGRLRLEGAKITFAGVTSPLMEAMDFISNLVPPDATIESVYLPYCCTSCSYTFQELYSVDELLKRKDDLLTASCVKCGMQAEFDNIPEIFFKEKFKK